MVQHVYKVHFISSAVYSAVRQINADLEAEQNAADATVIRDVGWRFKVLKCCNS